jgi:hypothetical protein
MMLHLNSVSKELLGLLQKPAVARIDMNTSSMSLKKF